jgi:hypothetical protein
LRASSRSMKAHFRPRTRKPKPNKTRRDNHYQPFSFDDLT